MQDRASPPARFPTEDSFAEFDSPGLQQAVDNMNFADARQHKLNTLLAEHQKELNRIVSDLIALL